MELDIINVKFYLKKHIGLDFENIKFFTELNFVKIEFQNRDILLNNLKKKKVKVLNYFLKRDIFPFWPEKHMNLALIKRDGELAADASLISFPLFFLYSSTRIKS